jgi:peptidyl-prolyl cis-trans isomerase SurA
MEPAVRQYLTTMREEAYIDIKPGFEDTGASTNKRVTPIASAAYTPPAPKKKKKVERTRFRETAHFRQKTSSAPMGDVPPTQAAPAEKPATPTAAKSSAKAASMKPGKKEKIRFGKAPTKTLPSEPQGGTEDAGAVAQNNQPDIPVEAAAPPEKKTRFSARAREAKQQKAKKSKKDFPDNSASNAPDAAEVADRQTQSAPLGLSGNAGKKKKATATTGEKTRLSDKKKDDTEQNATPVQPTPIPAVPGAPAPAQAPATTPAPPQ